MIMIILELYKKENVIENCGTIDYYKNVKVGQLCFNNKATATSIKIQLIRQKLFDDIKLLEDKSE